MHATGTATASGAGVALAFQAGRATTAGLGRARRVPISQTLPMQRTQHTCQSNAAAEANVNALLGIAYAKLAGREIAATSPLA